MSESITTPEEQNLPIEETPPTKNDKPKKKEKRPSGKKRKKKIKKILLWLLILAVIGVFGAYKLGLFNAKDRQNEETYNTFTVAHRDIQNVLSGTGTLSPADSYTVTVLASGEIIEDYFEEGDTVTEDQLLMRLDSESLDSSLERAQNNYDNAKKNLNDLLENKADLTVYSDYTGLIKNMELEIGDDVMKGETVATIVDRDTMLIDIPFMLNDASSFYVGQNAILTVDGTLEQIEGTVREIAPVYEVNENGVRTLDVTIAVANPGAITEKTCATATVDNAACTASAFFYNSVDEVITSDASGKIAALYIDEGSRVTAGQVVMILESETLDDSIEKAEQSLKEATTSLKDAGDAYDNYEITAPIAGTVVQKNYKKGEKIGSSNGGNTLAIIYDLSSLKFDMNIDELDIDSLSVGQEVNITSDAKPGTTYVGSITNISIQGTTSNGTTYYPITVTLEDYGNDEDGNKLRPGMNIDAEIILEKSENALVVPVDAVGRGNKVKVIKNPESYLNTANNLPAQAPEGADDKGFNGTPDESGAPSGEATPPDGNRPSASGAPSDEAAPDGEPKAPAGNENGENAKRPEDRTLPENAELPEGMTPPTGMTGGYSTVPKTAEYEEVTVETGISDDEYIEILSGLEEGDVVIVESTSGSQNAFGMMGGMGMGGMGGGMPMGGGMGGGGGAPGGGGMGGGPGGR